MLLLCVAKIRHHLHEMLLETESFVTRVFASQSCTALDSKPFRINRRGTQGGYASYDDISNSCNGRVKCSF